MRSQCHFGTLQGVIDAARGREGAPAKTGPVEVSTKKRGRPPGKRSNPDFEQITAYIRKDTHQGVKIVLLQEGKGQEFSELVEKLLSGWLTKQNQVSKS